MNRLLDLFLTFARIGGLTFGGGYAMLPILQREVVEKKKWTTEEELMDYYAIGQCTPGVIAVNTATFVGQGLAGPIGGIVATLGVVFPSLIIITVIAAFIQLRTPCDRPERFRGDPCLCLRPDLQCGRKALEKSGRR